MQNEDTTFDRLQRDSNEDVFTMLGCALDFALLVGN